MEALIAVLRMLADGARGPVVHELLDKLEAAGHVPAPPAPSAPPAAPVLPAPTPFGGTK